MRHTVAEWHRVHTMLGGCLGLREIARPEGDNEEHEHELNRVNGVHVRIIDPVVIGRERREPHHRACCAAAAAVAL